MRMKAALEGSLEEYLEKEYQNCAKAVTYGVKTATNGLKQSLRAQVKNAGLGGRLANTWRGDVYPKSKNSVSAAGVVYTKAEKILEGFEYSSGHSFAKRVLARHSNRGYPQAHSQ